MRESDRSKRGRGVRVTMKQEREGSERKRSAKERKGRGTEK